MFFLQKSMLAGAASTDAFRLWTMCLEMSASRRTKLMRSQSDDLIRSGGGRDAQCSFGRLGEARQLWTLEGQAAYSGRQTLPATSSTPSVHRLMSIPRRLVVATR